MPPSKAAGPATASADSEPLNVEKVDEPLDVQNIAVSVLHQGRHNNGAAGRDPRRIERELVEAEKHLLALANELRGVKYYGPPGLRDDGWWRDPVTIPPRQFLFGRHYARGAIGATVAAGGRFKTSLSHFEAVSMAVGRNLITGEPLPCGPLRVLTLNGEEDQDELDRRIAAACQRYKVGKADLGGRMIALSTRDRPMRVAVVRNGQPQVDEAVMAELTRLIERHRIDVFMVDPLISFHSVNENDNSAMDLVIKQAFGAIAGKTNAAGEVFYHVGKLRPGDLDSTVEDGRGASAILWAVRSARVLNYMTPAEAKRLSISADARKLHIRITTGKANMGPVGGAVWIKLEVEHLANGDEVAVAVPWQPTGAPRNGAVDRVTEVAQQVAQGGAYRDSIQSPAWFGFELARRLDIDVVPNSETNSPQDVERLKGVIETLKKSGIIAVETRMDSRRKKRGFIVLGPRSATVEAASDDDEESLV